MEIKGNPRFLEENDKQEYMNMQRSHEVQEAEDALENAKRLFKISSEIRFLPSCPSWIWCNQGLNYTILTGVL